MSSSPKESERVLRVSTDDVPPDRRQAYWQEAIARLHLAVDLDPDRSAGFSAALTAVALDDVNLVQMQTTAMAWKRPGRARDRGGEERCLFIVGQGGQVDLEQDDRQVAVGSGDMVLIDSRLSCVFSVAAQASILALSLPRGALTERIGAIDGIAATQL
ncbi:MAG: hypothetical protein ABUL54_11400, partial [Dongia sp.]